MAPQSTFQFFYSRIQTTIGAAAMQGNTHPNGRNLGLCSCPMTQRQEAGFEPPTLHPLIIGHPLLLGHSCPSKNTAIANKAAERGPLFALAFYVLTKSDDTP